MKKRKEKSQSMCDYTWQKAKKKKKKKKKEAVLVVTFSKKEKRKKEAAILIYKGKGRWVISHQTHSLPTFLSSFFFKLGRKLFPLVGLGRKLLHPHFLPSPTKLPPFPFSLLFSLKLLHPYFSPQPNTLFSPFFSLSIISPINKLTLSVLNNNLEIKLVTMTSPKARKSRSLKHSERFFFFFFFQNNLFYTI